jgi:hypothetical protein
MSIAPNGTIIGANIGDGAGCCCRGKNERTTLSVFRRALTATPRNVLFFILRSSIVSFASSSDSMVTNQESPISLLKELMGLHPSKLKISLTSSIGASDGISRRMIVLLPPNLRFALILLSTIVNDEPTKASRSTASSLVSAFNFANWKKLKIQYFL